MPVTGIASLKNDEQATATGFANSLLFETFLKGAGVREALVPASLEGGMYGDFLIQQLAQDLAKQFAGTVPGNPYMSKP